MTKLTEEDCGVFLNGGEHSSECDARTEAVEQAREDGARLALAEAMECALAEYRDDGTAQRVAERIAAIDPASIRSTGEGA